jgi:hypothetical protein
MTRNFFDAEIPGVAVALGQLYRRATHVARFKRATNSPLKTQEAKLLQIVRANKDTAFGKKHHFDKIKSIVDFQKFVPPANYDDLAPYIDALKVGKKKQLTAEEPFMFATTSGTTAQPKFIPITESYLRDYTHAFQVYNYHLINDFPAATKGRALIISSNDEAGHLESGLPYGAVSGLLNRRQPEIIRRHFAVPYELCKIKDIETKYYLMLRLALVQNITTILCCNPSSLLLLSDQLREHAEDLIRDLIDGTVCSRYELPLHFREKFDFYFQAHVKRGRQLDKMLKSEGVLLPKTVWPRLQVLSCWKGGPMSFYLSRLGEIYGDVPVRDFGYMASEGRGSLPLNDDGAGGVLAVTSQFFEFVSESQFDKKSKIGMTFLTADQLQLGQRYYIYFTTAAGLYRYNINDLVEVVAFYAKTPVIQFVRKGLGVSSITGEKVTEEQVLVALQLAVRQLNLVQMSHFTAEVELSYPPRYVCFAEIDDHELSQSLVEEFIRIFDHSLKMQNPEYEEKRSSKRLGMPVLRILPAGTYKRLRQHCVLEGAPEAQVKIPLLSATSSFSEKLALL